MGEGAPFGEPLSVKPSPQTPFPLSPLSPRKLIAERGRIYSAPGARDAPRATHVEHLHPGPDRCPLRSKPSSTHARSAAHSSGRGACVTRMRRGAVPTVARSLRVADSPTVSLKPLDRKIIALKLRLSTEY